MHICIHEIRVHLDHIHACKFSIIHIYTAHVRCLAVSRYVYVHINKYNLHIFMHAHMHTESSITNAWGSKIQDIYHSAHAYAYI
jgi:hypothetical protein